MIDVTCFQCGTRVRVSPDEERCASCGANLRRLILPEQASRYFYARAADMSAAGNIVGALQETQRGLVYIPSSELNMLAAIFSSRLGHFDDMRHYVAAIPVDDPLRGEAEWLLRSRQARQRAARIDKKKAKQKSARKAQTVAGTYDRDEDALPLVMEDVMPSASAATRRDSSGWAQPMLWLGLAAVMLLFAWLLWNNPPAGLAALLDQAGGELSGPSPVSASGNMATELPGAPAALGAEEPVTETAQSAEALPDPSAADSVVDSQTVDAAPVATADAPFDWNTTLRNVGRPDLAALPLTATLAGSSLTLEGTVQTAEQLAAVEFQARQVPGVETVIVDGVKLELPATYIVQEGDTLWGISVRLYGDPKQVEAIYAANQDVMPSPNALSIGMELKVPPAVSQE